MAAGAAPIEALASAQRVALQALQAVGLAHDAHGQPAWPFAHRLAVETLAIDPGLGRRALIGLACAVAATLLLAAGARFARGRWPAWGAAALLLFLAPWPAPSLLLTDAVPTSFHRSPTGFEAASIERGLGLYRQHCSACHGDDGRGETALAATLPVWPPRLDGPLLWRRAEGETFWRILHGLRSAHGTETMPGFAARLDDAQVWAVIDAMTAMAAGRGVRDDAAWTRPVRAPEAIVRCAEAGAPRPLSAWRGQRLRLVAGRPGDAPPPEDPRLVTIALRAAGDAAGGCAIVDAAAWRAYARVAGADPAAFAGAQLIVDRDGWLRALGRPGERGWSDGDLLCRSAQTPTARPRGGRDGLGALIAAIDADPIVARDGGPAHRR